MDEKRKPKLPLKRVPPAIGWLLQNATGDQLEYLNRLAKSADFKNFIDQIAKFKEYNVYMVFEYVPKTDQDLIVYRSYRRGEVDALQALAAVARLSGEEINRRKKINNV